MNRQDGQMMLREEKGQLEEQDMKKSISTGENAKEQNERNPWIEGEKVFNRTLTQHLVEDGTLPESWLEKYK